jgi:hypothetical protein
MGESASAASPRRNLSVTKRRRAGSQVNRLVERISQLVAERRALEGKASADRLEASRLEIDRLKQRLAKVVRRELSGTG